jgi:hypothetical protein
MPLSLLAVIVDCHDALRLAGFWAEVLGGAATPRNPGECVVISPGGGTPLYFMEVPEPKRGKNRLHLDVATPGSMQDEVERLVALGATLHEVRTDPASFDNPDTWTVMTDPEGHEFCVSSTSTLTGWG